MRQSGIVRVVFSVTGVLLLGKLLGFVKQMVIAAYFGTTIETDLLSLSQNFIGDFEYVLAQTLLAAFVSVYIHTEQEGEEKSRRLVSNTLKLFTLIVVLITVVIELAAPWIARLLAPTYSQELSGRLAGYLRLFAPVLIPYVWGAVFQALLNAKRRFLPGQMQGINQSMIYIVCVALLSAQLGIKVLIVSFFLYIIWNTVFLAFCARKKWSFERGNPFHDPAVRELVRMMGPLLLGYAMVYINQQVDKALTSGLEAGTVTALSYAAILSNLVGTFVVSFCGILFPYVTERIAREDHAGAAELAVRTEQILMMVFLPISILTVLCSEDIVTIVFARGAFNDDSVRIAAAALRGYAVGIVPLTLRETFIHYLYGYKDTKRPMINSSLGILCNIILSIALCHRFGVMGVTFASAVSTAVCGVLNLRSARRQTTQLSCSELLRALPLMLLGGIVCGMIAVYGSSNWWTDCGALARFALCTLCGGGAYMLIVSPMLWQLMKQLRRG